MSIYTTEFLINKTKIRITTEIYEVKDIFFVKADEFRPYPSISHPSQLEWESDTNFLCNELGKLTLNTIDDWYYAFSRICIEHINEFGRIIDVDLYNYIDETVSIAKVLVSQNGQNFGKEEGESFWIDLKDFSLETFEDNIWMHKFSKNPLQKTILVKLSEFDPWNN